MSYDTEQHGNQGRQRFGSPIFYALLESMAETHDKKSHDYASNNDPFANYKFAGMLSKLFDNSDDAGFIGRIGEKLFRLANIENCHKNVLNESIEDTEVDIAVIVLLWISMRRDRRMKDGKTTYSTIPGDIQDLRKI